MLRHWEKACSVATLGEGVQCSDTGRRRAVLRHWENGCSVVTLGEDVKCCDTGRSCDTYWMMLS